MWPVCDAGVGALAVSPPACRHDLLRVPHRAGVAPGPVGLTEVTCQVGTWMQVDGSPVVGSRGITDRSGRWACERVGRHGRSVSQVAAELGCDWHAVNRPVIAHGTALIDDAGRIGDVAVLGLDMELPHPLAPRVPEAGRGRAQQAPRAMPECAPMSRRRPRLTSACLGRSPNRGPDY